jgi:hypothetical protein
MPTKLKEIIRKYSKDFKTDSSFKYALDKNITKKVEIKANNLSNKTKLSLKNPKSKKKKRLLNNAIKTKKIKKNKKNKKLTVCVFTTETKDSLK